MQYRGEVVRHITARDSKSERTAVMLRTSRGEFVLRREGGHPFHDPVLDGLVGTTIEADGVLDGSLLIISSWRVVDSPVS
jgi:hypothetical protein